MARDSAELRSILESLLCAHGEPLTVDKATEVIGGVGRGEVGRALADLQRSYEEEGRGLRIGLVAGGYQLRTAPEHAEYVRRLLRERPLRLSRPMLETLAIIAYRQEITRAEIEAIRGVDVDSTLSTLLERRLIRITGRKEAPGRPLLYATSREFLEVFGLSDLSDLPTLRELGDIGDVAVQMAAEVDLRREAERDGEPAGEARTAIRLDAPAGPPGAATAPNGETAGSGEDGEGVADRPSVSDGADVDG
jgi:segregation and condensation protein B